jgi:hypothetical protein
MIIISVVGKSLKEINELCEISNGELEIDLEIVRVPVEVFRR